MQYPWDLYLMAVMYIVAGIMHFVKPKAYLPIMPDYLPNHKLLVKLSGWSEIILGIGLCFPLLKNSAIYAIILMLVSFLSVHFFMLSNPKASAGLPKWVFTLRIPLQFGLIYWAYWYLQF